ncbi:hypothetical protein ACFL1N_17370, partial [Thermodesulfobacteriota bacterium]
RYREFYLSFDRNSNCRSSGGVAMWKKLGEELKDLDEKFIDTLGNSNERSSKLKNFEKARVTFFIFIIICFILLLLDFFPTIPFMEPFPYLILMLVLFHHNDHIVKMIKIYEALEMKIEKNQV